MISFRNTNWAKIYGQPKQCPNLSSGTIFCLNVLYINHEFSYTPRLERYKTYGLLKYWGLVHNKAFGIFPSPFLKQLKMNATVVSVLYANKYKIVIVGYLESQ